MMISLGSYAQDVTKFLGIPVDGTKEDFEKELVQKGFKFSRKYNGYKGVFNNEESYVHIYESEGKVYRVSVMPIYTFNEGEAKRRYNTLCQQFATNKNYIQLSSDESLRLDVDEDLDYGINVKGKRYEAYFSQVISDSTRSLLILSELYKHFSPIQIANPTEEESKKMLEITKEKCNEIYNNNLVWVVLSMIEDRYTITIMYENNSNDKRGSDL